MTTARFILSRVEDNTDGWGPINEPEKLKDIPSGIYAPFNKGDKLGKAADWQQQATGKGGKYQQKEQSSGISTIFDWRYQDDDNTFQLVDSTKAKRFTTRKFQKNYQQGLRQQTKGQNAAWQQQQQKQRFGGNQMQQKRPQQQLGRWQQPGRPRYGDNAMNRKREPSIHVKEDWKVIEEIEYAALNKLSMDAEPSHEDLYEAGTLEYYNPIYDRITTKSDTILERTDRAFFNVTTSDDPIIRQLSMEGAGTVFATDAILTHLMSTTRSVYPWDIVVQRVGSKLFFDKRDGAFFDFLTVNETSIDPPMDDPRDPVNSASALMREATFINQNFTQQILNSKNEPVQLKHPNPFQSEGQAVASVGYKYRKFNLGNDIVVVARCEVDGVSQIKGKAAPITIKAVNEFDPRGDWKKRIDAQRGAVVLTELKNNANKFAKWILQSTLAGTETIKLGFVPRVSAKDYATHQILATQDWKPRELATQMQLSFKNAWAVLKKIVEVCMQQPNGKYILVKDPERPMIRLYSVPEGALEALNAESKASKLAAQTPKEQPADNQ